MQIIVENINNLKVLLLMKYEFLNFF